MSAAPASSTAARHHLARRLNAALARDESATTPMVVVDLDAFDANATDLVRRAGDKPVRLASKSLRIPGLMQRALAVPGFGDAVAGFGVLAAAPPDIVDVDFGPFGELC